MSIFCIFKKELKAYLVSPLFYLLAFVFSTFLSAKFIPTVFNFAQISALPANVTGGGANIHMSVFMMHLNLVYLLMLFLTPLFTMRLLAEEKKEQTLNLLLTAPVGSFDIVLGKFLAAWSAVSLFLLLALLYPLSVGFVADFDYGPLWGSYVAMFLLLGLNTAIGLFASSLTSSSLMASFLGLLMVLAVMLSGSFAGSINHPFWSALVEQLSVVLHMQDFFNGSVDFSGFVFLLSAICLFCFFAQRVLESSRWR